MSRETLGERKTASAGGRTVLGAFFIASVLLLGLLATLRGMPLGGDPFARNDTLRLLRLNNLPGFDLAALRLFHARQMPVFDVAVFGNSHAIQIAAEDIGLRSGTFFNFAVPGSSFRQSVNMVAALDSIHKRPATIVISLDNLALNHVAAPEFPGFMGRLKTIAGDLFWLLSHGQPKLAAYALVNSARAEWRTMRETASFSALRARASVWIPRTVASPRPWVRAFRPDGSRELESAVERKQFSLAVQPLFVLWRPYLARDFERLERTVNGQSRVVIYESLLAPDIEIDATSGTAAAIEDLRGYFLSLCKKHGFECYGAPGAANRHDVAPWSDCCHAPPAVLGPRIEAMLRNRRQPS